MRIDQLVHTLNYGDAISNEAITLQRVLRQKGVASQIYSVHAHEKVRADRLPYEQLQLQAEQTLLLHYSIASPLNELYLNAAACKRVMLYHNLTPERFFQSYNARVTADLIRAREDLLRVGKVSDVVLADSDFNRRELESFGISGAEVFPLVFDPKQWEVAANSGIAAALRGHGGKNILHVGRLAPNKCIEDIIRAFYFLYHKIDHQTRLWIVGSDIDTEIYSFELRRLVRELRLEEAVTFTGSVADSELRAFYENSDLYVTMSEHEGFCVPLLEAMNFGLPVVAFASSAVPETVGSAAYLIAQKDPALTAELFAQILTDQPLRQKLIAAGRARSHEFGLAPFVTRVEKMLLESRENLGDNRVSNRT